MDHFLPFSFSFSSFITLDWINTSRLVTTGTLWQCVSWSERMGNLCVRTCMRIQRTKMVESCSSLSAPPTCILCYNLVTLHVIRRAWQFTFWQTWWQREKHISPCRASFVSPWPQVRELISQNNYNSFLQYLYVNITSWKITQPNIST